MGNDNANFMTTVVTSWVETANRSVMKKLKPGEFPSAGFRILSSGDGYLVVMTVEDGLRYRITIAEEQ